MTERISKMMRRVFLNIAVLGIIYVGEEAYFSFREKSEKSCEGRVFTEQKGV
jgi:DNA repair protein RadC